MEHRPTPLILSHQQITFLMGREWSVEVAQPFGFASIGLRFHSIDFTAAVDARW
jgi:hypothetical protein